MSIKGFSNTAFMIYYGSFGGTVSSHKYKIQPAKGARAEEKKKTASREQGKGKVKLLQ